MSRATAIVAGLLLAVTSARAEMPQPDCDIFPLCGFQRGSAEVTSGCHALIRDMVDVWWRAREGIALGWCRTVPPGQPPLPPRMLRIEIRGFASDAGGPDANLALSKRRAAAIAVAFRELGIPSDHLTTHGYGDSRLLDPKNPADPINRHAELLFDPPPGSLPTP